MLLEATKLSHTYLSPTGLLLVGGAVLVGDNGKKIVDTMTNQQMELELAGGRARNYSVMKVVSMVAEGFAAWTFWKRVRRVPASGCVYAGAGAGRQGAWIDRG